MENFFAVVFQGIATATLMFSNHYPDQCLARQVPPTAKKITTH
jgi:hypothetical protein